MNVQKIFDLLQEDLDSTPLGIICAELEEQGYRVQVDNRDVGSADIYHGRQKDLEDKLGPFNITLYKNDSLEQEFMLEFLDDHEVVIERKIE